jgi:hypothetical protein
MEDQLNAPKKIYEKLGGGLLVFVILQSVLFVLTTVVTIDDLLSSGSWFYTLVPYFFLICITYICINGIVRKPPNALSQIRNILRIYTIIGAAALIIIILVFFVPTGSGGEIPLYLKISYVVVVVFNFAWHLFWYLYFKRSRRAAVYFGLLSAEDNTGVQETEKKLEQAVIDAFIEQNALTKETAVDPERLSINILDTGTQYASVVHNMRFMKRLIKEVSGKYYYDASNKGKYFGNLPVKFFKIIGIILLVCFLIIIVTTIFSNCKKESGEVKLLERIIEEDGTTLVAFEYEGDNDYPTMIYSTKCYIYHGEAKAFARNQ